MKSIFTKNTKKFPCHTLLLISAILSLPCLVSACECIWVGSGNTEPLLTFDAIDDYPMIFSGMPIRMDLDYSMGEHSNVINFNGMKVTLMVFKVWKGQEAKEITIHTGLGGGDCGFRFELGDNYLVFPKSQEGNALPEVDTCNRTKRMHDAGDNLAVLREFQDKSTSTGK